MAEVAAKFTADISGYKSAMSRMSSSTTSATKNASSLGNKVSNAMKKVGKVTMAAGAATTAMGVSALKSYGTFQQSLNKAAIVAGGTSKDIGELADMANKMGAELPLSAQDAADAMVSMAQDGASIKTITKEFPAIAEAATATGADLQTTAGTVQQAMNVWGKSLKSPAKAAAILTQTANLSNASVEEMSGAIANVGGVASQAGFGMNNMTESVGLLTNKGFTAQRASRDLAHAIIQMEAPSKGAKKQMKALGLSFTDAQGKMKPFPTILKEVADATDGMSASEKTAALKAMFNTAGMQAMLPLLDSVNDKSENTATSWDAYAKAQDGASSSTATATKFLKDQAKDMQKNVGSKIEQVGGNWESLRNKSMASESTITGGMVDMINKTLTWSGKSSSGIAKVIRGFIGLSPVIGPAVTATGTFLLYAGKIVGVASSAVKGIARLGMSAVSAAGRLLGAGKAAKTTNNSLAPMTQTTKSSAAAAGASASNFLKMGAAVALIGTGVLAAAAGIALLVQSAINLAKAGTNAQVTMVALAVGIVALAGVFALLGPVLTASSVGIAAFGAAILAIGIGVAAFGVGVNQVAKAIALLSGKMSSIVPVMSAMGAGFSAMLTSFIEGILTAAPQISAAFINMIVTMMAQLAAAAPQMTASFMQILTGMMTAIATNAPALVASFAAMIVSLINALASAIPSIVEAGVNLIVALAAAIGDNANRIVAAGIALIGQLAEAFVTGLPLLVQIMGATMAAIVAVIATYIGKFSELGGVAIEALKAGFTGKKYDAVGAATDVIKSAGTAASTNGQAAFKAAGGNAAIQSAKAIANTKGSHQSAGSSVGKAGASGVSSTSGSYRSVGSKNGAAAASGLSGKSGSSRSSGSSVGRSGASGISATSGYFNSAGSKNGGAAARGISSRTGSANSAGSKLGSAGASGAKSKHSSFNSAGSYLGSGLANGISSMFGSVMSAAGRLANAAASKIKRALKIHSPSRVTYAFGGYFGAGFVNGMKSTAVDVSKMSTALADSAVSGLNSVDTKNFTDSINSVAGDIKTGDLSMQAASYQGGSIDQNIDTDNWVKPTYIVHNELVGDKIRTIVSQGQADDQVSSKFFMS